MPPLQPALTAPPHFNQRLLSDHYLDVTRPGLPAWRQMADERVYRLFDLTGGEIELIEKSAKYP